MRYIFYIALLYSFPLMSQTSIYDLKVQTAYGGELRLQHLKGRKILIAVVSVENLNRKGGLELWDSITTANPNVACILIPASDMDTVSNDSAAMVSVRTKTSKKLILSDVGSVRKDRGEKQHPLMRWLTDVSQNEYFNSDVTTDQQLYVISESGILYAIMEKGVRMAVVNEVLKSADVKPSPFGRLKR
ncbi:MAG: hypothetical protein JNK79_16995 [Chitinophagaceae bacterium]|nr:hypothetical protein [Chitinophagaceae bacterium]